MLGCYEEETDALMRSLTFEERQNLTFEKAKLYLS